MCVSFVCFCLRYQVPTLASLVGDVIIIGERLFARVLEQLSKDDPSHYLLLTVLGVIIRDRYY